MEDWTLWPGCQPATSKYPFLQIGDWESEKDSDGFNQSRQKTFSSGTIRANGYSEKSPLGVLDKTGKDAEHKLCQGVQSGLVQTQSQWRLRTQIQKRNVGKIL